MSLALQLEPGKPYPLGATTDATGVNFAIYSAHATQVLLCLFDDSGHSEIAQIKLIQGAGHIWYRHLSGITDGQLYGYRINGVYQPGSGLLFNPHKLLVDPYAKAMQGEFNWSKMHAAEHILHPDSKSIEQRSTLISGALASYTKVACHMKDICPLCSAAKDANCKMTVNGEMRVNDTVAVNANTTMKCAVGTNANGVIAAQTKYPNTVLCFNTSACSNAANCTLVCNQLNNAADMPKSKVVSLPKYKGVKPNIPWEDTVIYECHVKGATQLPPEIGARQRGRFLGLAEPAFIQHLKSLGITTLELMPVQQFISEQFLVSKNLSNYWGYNTLNFFTPHSDYLSHGDIAEFQQMVSILHKHNIEVIIDVVYNHTAEGGYGGPYLSWRGIDNLSYYRLDPQKSCLNINDTGCGNTININHPRTLQLIMDSMRYWVETMGVDGFRFDLAPILARAPDGFKRQHSFFQVIAQDPVLNQVKLIAEPWDIGPGGYQLGSFPISWHEWNDQYRDTMRRFWRGDKNITAKFAQRIHGSSDLFEHNGRGPSASINFITAHDGFTLTDLVSYVNKNNAANDEGNRDGHNHNCSSNCGIEGQTDDAAVLALRLQQQKNMLLTLLFSQGVPMIEGGSESQHSQQGNNNAYCQDNSMNWQKEDYLSNPGPLHTFIARAIKLRKQFRFFKQKKYIHENDKDFDILWLNKQGHEMSTLDWQKPDNQVLGWLITEIQNSSESPFSESLLLLFNASNYSVTFKMPALSTGQHWCVQLSSTEDYNMLVKHHCNDDFQLDAHSCWVLSSTQAKLI